RNRWTCPSVRLGAEQRLRNLRGQFALEGCQPAEERVLDGAALGGNQAHASLHRVAAYHLDVQACLRGCRGRQFDVAGGDLDGFDTGVADTCDGLIEQL